MSYWHKDPGFSIHYIVENYDFSSIGSGIFVDVGGSQGQVSIAVARRYAQLRCIVQDMEATIEGARLRVPADVKEHAVTSRRVELCSILVSQGVAPPM